MKDQVIMSKHNGELAIAIPLHKRDHIVDIGGEHNDYIVAFTTTDKPLAYALDIGLKNLTVMSAEYVEDNVIFLGDI